ncbi:hypothetical protein GYMLUDRAFT_197181 [Collybiopsis luxurians FD-317 M1]|uniref:Major facilitator superfamily (MFS) profile domain-containing protein n=1 Tax=Collybiopsis luxurians FD-317 M1 TaxID=944289 RepID=A0A0D0C464_9AGAR|nr:hypothetical protein GYMLUDRAFT_197181 [Collybiopsis luxurians FD-317 M1]
MPPSEDSAMDDKPVESRLEETSSSAFANFHRGDAALEYLGTSAVRYEITEEQERKVLRKIDRWLLPIILLVYFLQQLDKSSLSYTSVFGIVDETGLVGSQYSWLSSIVYIAQLVWQPVSSYMLLRLPVAKYLFVNVFLWGAVVACMAAAHNFKGLIAARFFLGIAEACVAPAFMTITQMWWRRREQTLRLSYWMAANGVTGMIGSLLSWGLGHIAGRLHPYQVIFLFIGTLTVACSPLILILLPDSPAKAKFLSREEKIVAFERLRANNQGTETKVWKWDQVLELVLDPKTYLWFALLFLCAVPSGGIGAFGPLIISGFGFNQLNTILFNIPFNFFQVVIILTSAAISTKIKLKWPVIFALCLPAIGGAAALLKLGRGAEYRGPSLAAYYILSFFAALQPLLYTWASQNTAGHTKKICTTATIFVAQCAGNVVGPLLYKTEDKPFYHPGLVGDMICWICLAVLTVVTAAYLAFRNKQQAAARRRLGKTAEVVDTSLEVYSASQLKDGVMNDKSFDDLTDCQNEDFIYVL